MKQSLKYLLALVFAAFVTDVAAQEVEMADGFRAEGKIYVVVAIIVIVLAGLITYLFLLERKLSRLEKTVNSKKSN